MTYRASFENFKNQETSVDKETKQLGTGRGN